MEKDLLIQEKEKLYVELRSILARQPGPEVAEQLGIYAKNLKEKNHQMQAMAAELHHELRRPAASLHCVLYC